MNNVIDQLLLIPGSRLWTNPGNDRDMRVYMPIPKLPKPEYTNIYGRVKIWYSVSNGDITGKSIHELHAENRRVINNYMRDLRIQLDIRDDWD